MESGNPLHQSNDNEGGLEANKLLFDPPLLPYERELVDFLGCTKEEYKKLIKYNNMQPRVRAAAYENVPDIVNEAVSLTAIVINLVIGVALTAASVLLAPKPSIPDQEKRRQIRQQQLPDQIGPSRFNQTSSFSGFSALVQYGAPVPIPFGKIGTAIGEGVDETVTTGGIVLPGTLVWSRAFSEGTFQRIKLLYTFGEYLEGVPTLRSTWLGTTSLSSLGNFDFAYYWSSKQGPNRIKGGDFLYGKRGVPGSADPDTRDEIFTAPGEIEFDNAFCQVYNPNSKARFGHYNPIRNGTAHRLNWEVVSIPFSTGEGSSTGDRNDAIRRARAKRVKISGINAAQLASDGFNDAAGQPGVGRGYGTQMGLISIQRGGAEQVFSNKVPTADIELGDIVTFRLSSTDPLDLDTSDPSYDTRDIEGNTIINGDPQDYGISYTDVKSAVDDLRIQADEAMVLGSRWIIGNVGFIVVSRTTGIWNQGRTIDVKLECNNTLGAKNIGFAGTRATQDLLAGYEGPWPEFLRGPRPSNVSEDGFNTSKHCGAAFWNICKYDVASVRMIRAADTIEVGIKSIVFNQANGLCNFNGLLTPKETWKRDKDDIQLSTPALSRYFQRTSCFSIWIREIPEYEPIDGDEGVSSKPWSRIPQVFCVSGNTPQPLFNYIRLRPNGSQGPNKRYEFRFTPRTGSDVVQNGTENATYFRLNAQSGEVIGEDFQTTYGTVRVTFTGDRVKREAILLNSELTTAAGADTETGGVEESEPAFVPTRISFVDVTGGDFPINAWLTEVIGRNPSFVGDVGRGIVRFTKNRTNSPPGFIEFEVTAVAGNQTGPLHAQLYGTSLNWSNAAIPALRVIQGPNTGGLWTGVGEGFNVPKTISSSNRYRNVQSQVTVAFRVAAGEIVTSTIDVTQPSTSIGFEERLFEEYSQVSDCSHYIEITKSNANSPEHEIVYVNESVREDNVPQYEDLSMLGLCVKAGNNLSSVEQPRIWLDKGVSVERLEPSISNTFGPSNIFSDLLYYLLTNEKQGVGTSVSSELVDKDSFAETAKYLVKNRIFWTGVIEAETNLRSFAVENAGKCLCNFTIKNGVFGLMPALPVEQDGSISLNRLVPSQIFSAGNILENSLQVSFIDGNERIAKGISVRWRDLKPYELPEERTAIIYESIGGAGEPNIIEDLDLTQFCDNRDQALKTARFILASSRLVSKTISFETTPDVLLIQPGSYIQVLVEEVDFSAGLNVVINPDLSIRSVDPVPNGTYEATVLLPGSNEIQTRGVTTLDNSVTDPSLAGALISFPSLTPNEDIYQVQELTLSEDGIVSVTAVVVPTNTDGVSRVASLVEEVNPDSFVVIE